MDRQEGGMVTIIPAGIIRSATLLILGGLLATGIVRACSHPVPVSPALVRADTAAAAAWAAREAQLERELGEARGVAARLRRRLEGIERRPPRTVVIYDTIIDLRRDTVVLAAKADAGGRLTLDVALPASAGHRPRTERGAELGNCDEGWSIRGSEVTCDRARLGHLRLLVRAGARVEWPPGDFAPALEVGARWAPSYRSPWALEAQIRSLSAATLTIERHLPMW
jgi:hypothetical protein